MNIKNNRVGKFIRQRREALGLTQQDASSMLGWECKNAQVISNIERLKNGLPPRHMVKVCDVLKIDSSQLIEMMVLDYKETLVIECLKQREYSLKPGI